MQKTFIVTQPSTVTVTVPDPVISETIVPLTTPPENKPPVANAGTDQTITIPANSTVGVAVLDGTSSSDPDGTIKTYSWRIVSGSGAVIQNPSLAKTNVTMPVGTFIFELRVVDNLGGFGTPSIDRVTITVKKDVIIPPINTIPVAKAGSDQTVTLPLEFLNLDGSLSTDPDGQIKSFKWTKISGPTVTLINDTTSVVTLRNLLAGTYLMRLTITDNSDATNSDEVTITVKPEIVVEPPTANTYQFTLTQNKAFKLRHFGGFENWNGQNYASFPGGWKDYYFRFCFTDIIKGVNGTVDWTRFDNEFRKAISQGAGMSIGFMSVCDSDDFLALENYGGASSRYCQKWHNQMQAESVKDFSKNGMWIPNWNSPSFQANIQNAYQLVENHIETTSFNGVRYKDIINYIDIRLYAQWGEWHNGGLFNNVSEFPAGTRPTVATYKKMIDIHCDAFPNYPLVILFAAYDANWLPHTMTPPEVTYYALTKSNAWGKIGWRRDQWAAPDNYVRSYLEENTRSFSDSGPFNQIIMERWKEAPIVGEPIGPGGDLNDLKAQIVKYHATSVGNGNYPNNSTATAQFKEAVEEAGAKISLNKGQLKVSTEFDFDITLTAENFGNSPVYNDRLNLVYELRNSSGQVVWSANSKWKPLRQLKGVYAISDHYKITTVPTGTYSLKAVIKDSYRALPLFNDGQAADGYLTLHNAVKL